jgi:hypothetical protein
MAFTWSRGAYGSEKERFWSKPSFTFALVWGPQDGGGLRVLSLFTASAALLAAFVATELRQARPMPDLSLFRYPRFIGVQLNLA